MTVISGVPDELDGYSRATYISTLNLGAVASGALRRITAFNEANAGSDVAGSIPDVATPVDRDADILADHNRIPGIFADALVTLDDNGHADDLGRYHIDARYSAFLDAFVSAGVEGGAPTDEIFDVALANFDPAFAETFAEVRAQDPDGEIGDLWDAAVSQQVRHDFEELEPHLSDGFDQGGEALSAIMAAIEFRSGALGDGYAEQLYIDRLGVAGIEAVLDEIGLLPPRDDQSIRQDLVEPFAAGFAVAAASGRAGPLIQELTNGSTGSQAYSRLERLGLLLTGAEQPAAFVVPAATTLINFGSLPAEAHRSPRHDVFGDGPIAWEIVGVEALAANAEASAEYVPGGQNANNLRNLIHGPLATFMEDDERVRFHEAAASVLHHAVVTEGEIGTGEERTPTDLLLVDIIELAQHNVPDPMRSGLAALSASTMGRIGDFASEAGGHQGDVLAYFAELSYNEDAADLLLLGAVDQYRVGLEDGIAVFEEYTDDADSTAVLNNHLLQGTSDARALIGTLGAAFDLADVSTEQRHGSMIAALNWVSDAATGAGLAVAPVSGGTGFIAGLTINTVVDIGVDAFGDATRPEATSAEQFIADVIPEIEQLTAQVLFDDPTMRPFIVGEVEGATSADAISFDEFAALAPVSNAAFFQGTASEEAAVLAILREAYFGS